MKIIKKIVIALAIAVVVSGAAFAQEKRYSGDIQFQLGGQFNSSHVYATATSGGTTQTIDARYFLYGGQFAISNWNLWHINDFFALGFYDKIALSLWANPNTSDSGGFFDVAIGPAIKFNVNDVVNFQTGVGINYGIVTFGLTVDAQAKFVPRSKVSPLVGFQYIYRNSLGILHINSFEVYAGCTINWGRR